nr:GNAT family protein [Kurthia massiliensis]
MMRIDQDNDVIFSTALQGTRMSTEAHQLLASYVFDELQYRRYEWKCDALNAHRPSKQQNV